MTKPTLDHITACDGTKLTVVTRENANGDLCIQVFNDKREGPVAQAEIGSALSGFIHFGSTDTRDCGRKELRRRWTTDDNEVTCPVCKAKDTLTLSPQGAAYVASLVPSPAIQAAYPEAKRFAEEVTRD